MATYSKYIGTSYETVSSSLLLDNAGTQSYAFTNNIVYTDLPNNTSKLIEPKSIRNAILSVYDTMPFKETSVGNSTYIGIDNGDTTNRDLKSKIYLGKRYSFRNEIMDSSLLSSNTDIFIYNTKSDLSSYQSKTSIVFLSGVNSNLNQSAPKIQAETAYDKNNNELIAFNIINNSNDINIISKGPSPGDSGAIVSINNIIFPTVQDSDPLLGGSSSNNRVLLQNNGSLIWSDLTINDPGYYGVTDSVLPIYGNPTLVNGYSLEFTDSRYSTIQIGDIKLGDTFNNTPIINVLERMIYEYLPPICTLSLYNTDQYFEVGTYPNVRLSYSITKRSENTLPTALTNMIPNSYPAITTYSNSYVTGIAKGIVIEPIENDTTIFTIKVSDGITVNSASASVTGIYPYFYGFTASNIMNTYGLETLNKKINIKVDETYDIYQSGVSSTDTFYFVYDFDYGDLSSILDDSDNNITSFFTKSVVTLSSPSGLWASKKFIVYKSTNIANDYLVTNAYVNNKGTMIFKFNF
jgi:hypothetical protein